MSNLESNGKSKSVHGLDDRIMSVDSVAAYLHIGRGQAYQLCRREGFPSIRLSERRIVVPRVEFEAWLHDQAGKRI